MDGDQRPMGCVLIGEGAMANRYKNMPYVGDLEVGMLTGAQNGKQSHTVIWAARGK